MKDGAELAAACNLAQQTQRRPEAPVVSDGEYDAGSTTRLEHARSMLAPQRQRLFAEYLLAGLCRRDHLREMLGMRRCQQHGLDAGIGENSIEAFGQRQTMRGTERARRSV